MRTVKLWVARFKRTGGVDAKRSTGRRPVVTPEAAQRALDYLRDGSSSAVGVARRLHQEGITPRQVHRRTVVRAAKKVAKTLRLNLRAQTGKPQPELKPAHKAQRIAFAKANLHRDWTRVMFTDRKKFIFAHPGSRVTPVTWTTGQANRRATTVSHPATFNVYAGLTPRGMTKIHVVAGSTGHKTLHKNKKGQPAKNITASQYKEVVSNTFLPEGDRLFKGRGVLPKWVLQQDNDPTHKVAVVLARRRNRERLGKVEVLKNWPPNSPDLNLIENVWAYVNARVQSRRCETRADFEKAVQEELQAVPINYIEKLYKSMPARLSQVLKNEGERTKY